MSGRTTLSGGPQLVEKVCQMADLFDKLGQAELLRLTFFYLYLIFMN